MVCKTTAVIVSRNDNYGGHLIERATFCLNTMLDSFDEVIYVDWNTPEDKPPLTDELDIVNNKEKLKVIIIRPDLAKKIMGEELYTSSQPCCEVLGRNIGIRRATGDYILSTNIDIICPNRYQIDYLIENKIKKDEMLLLFRNDIELEVVNQLKHNYDYNQIGEELLKFGVPSLYRLLTVGLDTMKKDILFKIHDNKKRYLAASVMYNCGDFQFAHRDLWFNIKGFEESQIKRNGADTQLQFKALMYGYTIKALNFPPIYHINHERNPNHPENDLYEFFDNTFNKDTWGFSTEIL
jgi:hypothetical protein